MPKLKSEQKEACDKPINESNIIKSKIKLSIEKTQVSDGLPSDFYKFFWCDIKYLLTHGIIYAMQKGELSIEQKCGIIKLIYKQGKTRLHLKSWTPISLLNTQYNIITNFKLRGYKVYSYLSLIIINQVT